MNKEYLINKGFATNTVLEEKLAILEGGEACMSMSSGMGAITSTIWTALKAGDHIVAAKTIYGCTHAFLSHGIARFGVEVTFVDVTDPENVRKAMKENTRVVFLETPANPTLLITDIEEISKIAHENKNCIVMVDNTFSTPYIQRLLELGADVVIHSGTKFLNGHGDPETLIEHPASMTHSSYPLEERLEAGISDGLIRLAVGLENKEDIISDLDQALNLIIK